MPAGKSRTHVIVRVTRDVTGGPDMGTLRVVDRENPTLKRDGGLFALVRAATRDEERTGEVEQTEAESAGTLTADGAA